MTVELNAIVYVNDMGKTVLNGLEFSLKKGETVGLRGRNGSGKTTLLNVMMGFLKPRSGTIRVDGDELGSERDFQRRRGGTLGMLFQQSEDQLFCPSVEEEVAFGPLNQKRPLAQVCETVDTVLREVGLEGYQKRIPHKLSGGEKRLVALASVVAMNPAFLLLDEPIAGLDEVSKTRMLEVLGRLDSGMLVVSHDREVLVGLCDRQVELRDGQLHHG